VAGPAVLLAAAVLAGCTTSAAPPPPTASTAPTPSPTTTSVTAATTTTTRSPAPAGACGVVPAPGITIAAETGTCQVTAPVGATVRVELDTGFDWGDPVSDAASVRVEDVQRPAGGGLDAVLAVVATGAATVSATGTVACAPDQACPALARLWSLRVDPTPG
jgi:hypothetical protein